MNTWKKSCEYDYSEWTDLTNVKLIYLENEFIQIFSSENNINTAILKKSKPPENSSI